MDWWRVSCRVVTSITVAIDLEKNIILTGLRMVVQSARCIRGEADEVCCNCAFLNFRVVLAEPRKHVVLGDDVIGLRSELVSHLAHQKSDWSIIYRHSLLSPPRSRPSEN